MKINLKKLTQNKEVLKYTASVLRENAVTKSLAKKLDEIIRLLEEIETDLELSGESILELDMDRLKAIEIRNKHLTFLKHEDEP